MSTKTTLKIVFVLAALVTGCGASPGRAKSEGDWNDCNAGECSTDADQLEVVMTPPPATAQTPAPVDSTRGGTPRNAKR